LVRKTTQNGHQTVGIPKTIDMHLVRDGYTLGYDTAINLITRKLTGSDNAGIPRAHFRVKPWTRMPVGMPARRECSGPTSFLSGTSVRDMDKVCSLLRKEKAGNKLFHHCVPKAPNLRNRNF
jgi:hypothetical protein